MITNMRIETSDEDRRLLAVYLERDSATKRLATRNDIKDLVTQFISDLIQRAGNGEFDDHEDPDDAGRHRRDLDDDGSTGHQGLPERPDPNGAGFRPSRGDESYLYKPRSVALKDACSAMLDQAEVVEQLVWDVLEANREK